MNMKIIVALTMSMLLGIIESKSQSLAKLDQQNLPTHELFFRVLTSSNADKVKIYWDKGHTSSPRFKHTLERSPSGEFVDVCTESDGEPVFHWVVEVGGTFGAGETCDEFDTWDMNDLYTLKLESLEGGVVVYSSMYLYFNCADGWNSTEVEKKANGFYCLKKQTEGGYVDMSIELDDKGFGLFMTDVSSQQYKYMEDVFSDNKWIFPHHGEFYCENAPKPGQGGETASCNVKADTARITVMPFQPTLDDYELTTTHMVVKDVPGVGVLPRHAVYFGGVKLTFAPGTELVVGDRIDFQMDGTELTFNGTAGGGMTADRGSTVNTFGGARIVGSGSGPSDPNVTFTGDGTATTGDDYLVSGNTTFSKIEVTIEDGNNGVVEDGATLFLDGDLTDPARFIVEGVLVIRDGGLIQCQGSGTELIGNGVNWTQADNIDDQNLAGSGIDMNCSGACLVSDNGASVRIKAGSALTFGDGGFLALKNAGSIVLEDNAQITFDADAGDYDIDAGATFLMGKDAVVTFGRALNLNGTSGSPITFERLNPVDAWDYLDLIADGNTLNHVIFDGGKKNLYVRSTNNTFNNIISRNGENGLSAAADYVSGRSSFVLNDATITNSSKDGVVAINSDVTITNTSITGSGEAGLALSSATVIDMDNNTITGNASTDTEAGGIEVLGGGWLYLDDDAGNLIADNGGDEILATSSGQIHAGKWLGECGIGKRAEICGGGGFNDIHDASDPGTTYKYIDNNSSYGADAEKNYWGGTPVSGMFSGVVDYSPYTSTANTKRGVNEVSGENDRTIDELQDVIAERGIMSEAEDLAELYRMQKSDRKNAFEEYQQTMAIFRSLLPSYENAPLVESKQSVQRGFERTILILLQEDMGNGKFESAAELFSKYHSVIRSDDHRKELLGSAVALSEYWGDYSKVDQYLAQGRSLSRNDLSFDAELDLLERESRQSRKAARPQRTSATTLPQLDALAKTGDVNEHVQAIKNTLYPNPAVSNSVLSFTLAFDADVEVSIIDVLGRSVKSWMFHRVPEGGFRRQLDLGALASGTYLINVQAHGESGSQPVHFTRRLTVLR